MRAEPRTISEKDQQQIRSVPTSVQVRAESSLGCVDLTDELRRAIAAANVTEGCSFVFCTHTTCAILINEWEDGAFEDLRRHLQTLFPSGEYYAHDDLSRRTQNLQSEERRNGHAHVAQMILGGSSHAVPIGGGRPLLGRWQRLFLLELDEPQERTVRFHIFGH